MKALFRAPGSSRLCEDIKDWFYCFDWSEQSNNWFLNHTQKKIMLNFSPLPMAHVPCQLQGALNVFQNIMGCKRVVWADFTFLKGLACTSWTFSEDEVINMVADIHSEIKKIISCLPILNLHFIIGPYWSLNKLVGFLRIMGVQISLQDPTLNSLDIYRK